MKDDAHMPALRCLPPDIALFAAARAPVPASHGKVMHEGPSEVLHA